MRVLGFLSGFLLGETVGLVSRIPGWQVGAVCKAVGMLFESVSEFEPTLEGVGRVLEDGGVAMREVAKLRRQWPRRLSPLGE